MIRNGEYQRSWVRPDVLAGLTVAAMLVPQAMAYAELGGLEPSAGFRAALVALPIYVLIGTSRHLGVGPEPGTAILAAAAAASLAGGDADRFAALMALIAGLVGVLALTAGLFRLGFVADLLSKPVLVGYITGVGVTLLTSQLGAFTGVPIDAGNPFARIGQFLTGLGEIDASTFGVGLGTLLVILVLRRLRPTVPGALIGLIGSIVVVSVFDLDVAVVGEIDAALPTPQLPDVGWSDITSLLPAAAGVALIGYTDNILTARSISAKHGYEVDADRELLALGAMNVAGSMVGGFPMSSSASRSVVPSVIGSRSQASSAVAFMVVIGFLLVGTSLLAEIPQAGLAAVIIAAAIAVIDVDGFRRLAALSRSETGPGGDHRARGRRHRHPHRRARRRRAVDHVDARTGCAAARCDPRGGRGARRLDRRGGWSGEGATRPVGVPLRRSALLRQWRVLPRSGPMGDRGQPR